MRGHGPPNTTGLLTCYFEQALRTYPNLPAMAAALVSRFKNFNIRSMIYNG